MTHQKLQNVASYAIKEAYKLDRKFLHAKFISTMTNLNIAIAISLNKKMADYVIYFDGSWNGVKLISTNYYIKPSYIANLRRKDSVVRSDYLYVYCGDQSEYLIPYHKISTNRLYLSQFEENKLIPFDNFSENL